MNTTTKQVSVLATIALGVPLIVAAPAMAKGGGDRVRNSGSCAGAPVIWKLSGKQDDSRLEVEFEVDSNQNGQTWTVRLRDNGQRFFKGTRTTSGPSGSFTVSKSPVDYAGSDHITARAVHGDTVCRGSVTV
jgi:hypothetical protein